MTIRLQLTMLFVALLAAVGLIRSVAVLGGLESSLYHMQLADTDSKAQQVQDYLNDLEEENLRAHDPQVKLDSADALPRAFSDDGMYLQITTWDGQVVNKSANLGSLDLPIPVHAGSQDIDLPLPHLFESPRAILVARPLTLPGRGTVGWIEVAMPLQGVERTMKNVALIEVFGWIGSLALALAAGLYFAGRALRPVKTITDQVRGWTSSDLHKRLAVAETPRDEMDFLAVTFNGLFDRLEASFDAQQRFVADASHELKSPLTAIRGHLQLIKRRGEESPEEAKKWIDTALREVDRLTRLVNELLDLARAQADAIALQRSRSDLGSIAREVVEQYQVIAPRVAYESPPKPVYVMGDPDRLRQLLINLVDNAIRATRDGGHVIVAVAREGFNARVTIADGGTGMPPEALDRIFDRFYRVDAARDRGQGGTGLGLAIIAAIVKAHNGSIEVASALGEGSTFTVRLPLAVETGPLTPEALAAYRANNG